MSQYLVASPALVRSRPNVKGPADVRSWPWIELSGYQFREVGKITLYDRNRTERTLSIAPVLTSEGVTSIRQAVLAGLGIALMPEWLIHDDILSGRLLRVLPNWSAKDLPMHVVHAAQRVLPVRVRSFVNFAVDYIARALRSEE
jgi:DNA-binding transcriptional LysR family regulator